MLDPDCIFCKIIQGAIPSRRIYEDEECYAFMDIAPFEIGHTLVVPKIHVEFITDLPEKNLSALILCTQKIARNLLIKLPCDGINLLQNNGECATQSVPHVHFHVIPRWNNTQLNWHNSEKYKSGEHMAEIQKRIAMNEQ